MCKIYVTDCIYLVIVIPWFICLYEEIIHSLTHWFTFTHSLIHSHLFLSLPLTHLLLLLLTHSLIHTHSQTRTHSVTPPPSRGCLQKDFLLKERLSSSREQILSFTDKHSCSSSAIILLGNSTAVCYRTGFPSEADATVCR